MAVLVMCLQPLVSVCCSDVIGWVDLYGDGCQEYAAEGWCADGGYGPHWFANLGTFEDYAVNGVSAADACCICSKCDNTRQLDSGGDSCDYYTQAPGHCGCCDTPSFIAKRDCCACKHVDDYRGAEYSGFWTHAFVTWPAKARKLILRQKWIKAALAAAPWANLTSLTEVDLGTNALTGAIPRELGQLAQLVKLDLKDNQLHGPIPPELGQLMQLELLRLDRNQLRGRIPPTLGNLQNLLNLTLYENQLSGSIPPELGQLHVLREMRFQLNKLSGAIPRELALLTELKSLTLNQNALSGTIPPELGQLVKLKWLRLDSNSLRGPVPPELGRLVNLWQLFLSNNQLSGSIPHELGQLVKLTSLMLDSNQLSGPIPRELGQLKELETLSLQRNELNGNIPGELENCEHLFHFSASVNALTGPFPPRLFDKMTTLDVLDFSRNQLSGPIPSILAPRFSLRKLRLDNNKLSGSIPGTLGRLAVLKELYLASNQLTGTVPLELGDLGRLETLDLSRNHLEGQIPDISSMVSLVSLKADGCNFTGVGTLPPALQLLDLSHNSLRSLPTVLTSSAVSLTTLLLTDNNISSWPPFGVVPQSFYDAVEDEWVCGYFPQIKEPRLEWPNLSYLDISGNPLNASFRDFVWSVAYLPKLQSLRTSNCGLRGSIDAFVDMPHTGAMDCGGLPSPRPGFSQLLHWDVSRNAITTVDPKPPSVLTTVDLSDNELTHVNSAWFNLDGTSSSIVTLKLAGNPRLHADFELFDDELQGSCPENGASSFVVDPRSWRVMSEDFAVECAVPCSFKSILALDRSINETALCRCRAGAGSGTSCTPCPADTFSERLFDPSGWQRECVECPPHSTREMTTEDRGVESCGCDRGRFMMKDEGSGNATCSRCAQWPFRTTLLAGATGEQFCECHSQEGGFGGLLQKPLDQGARCGCPDGMFLDHVARRCVKCSIYEECQWGQRRFLQSVAPPAVLPGYWAAAPPTEYVDGLLQFEGHIIWRCTSSSTCRGGNECNGHRHGRACSLCEPGYFGGQDGPCRRCPDTPQRSRSKLGLAAAGLLFVPLVLNKLLQANPDRDKTGFILLLRSVRTWRSILRFCQAVSITSGFSVRWPDAVQPFFRATAALSLDIASWTGASCLVGWSSLATEVVALWLLPIVAVLLTFAAGAMVSLGRRRRCCAGGRVCRSRCSIVMGLWDCVRVLVFLLGVFFPMLLSSTLVVFTCMPTLSGHWTSYGWTVKGFPHVICGQSEEGWPVLAAVSGILALALGIAYPSVVYMAWIQECATRLKSSFTTGGWWAFFFDDFRAVHMDWPLAIIYKDIAINIVACAGAGYGSVQLLATALICFAFAYKCVQRLPYLDMSINVLEVWNGVALGILCTLTAGMGFQKEPGVGDVSQLFREGEEDPQYLQRAWTLVAVQVGCAVGPVCIVMYQILMSFERTQRCVPKRFKPYEETERAAWVADFCDALNMPQGQEWDFRQLLHDLDDVDYLAFERVMTRSVATLGVVRGSSMRRRLSSIARSERVSWRGRGSMAEAAESAIAVALSERPADDAGQQEELAALLGDLGAAPLPLLRRLAAEARAASGTEVAADGAEPAQGPAPALVGRPAAEAAAATAEAKEARDAREARETPGSETAAAAAAPAPAFDLKVIVGL